VGRLIYSVRSQCESGFSLSSIQPTHPNWRNVAAARARKAKVPVVTATGQALNILLVNPLIYDFTAFDFWLRLYGLLRVGG